MYGGLHVCTRIVVGKLLDNSRVSVSISFFLVYWYKKENVCMCVRRVREEIYGRFNCRFDVRTVV